MSATRRDNRSARHVCIACLDQRALFRYRGAVRADKDHTLCFRCFRSERERQRARLLASVFTRPLRMSPRPDVVAISR